METPRHYSPLQRTLHWLTALIVIIMIPVGFYMAWRGHWSNFDALTNTLYSWHKLIGFLLLWIVLVRGVVRLIKGAPPPEPTLSPLQRIAAEAVHLAIYALLFVVPLLGWYGVSAYGARTAALGVTLPALAAENKKLAEEIFEWHERAAVVLGLLVAAHIGAALMHRFILKDGVLARMWPGAGGKR